MIAKRKSIVAVSILLGSPGWCFCFHLLLGAMIVRTAQALSSLSSSSSSPPSLASVAASMSPLFRTCPPPQGPQDQQVQQHQYVVLGGAGSSVGLVSEQTRNPASNSNNAQQQKQSNKVNVKALQALGYPEGFCRALVHGATRRVYWIVDDSLSMSTKDGHFLLHTADGIEQAICTRWNELRETVLQHVLLALHLDIPTDFRLLNHAAVACGRAYLWIVEQLGPELERIIVNFVALPIRGFAYALDSSHSSQN